MRYDLIKFKNKTTWGILAQKYSNLNVIYQYFIDLFKNLLILIYYIKFADKDKVDETAFKQRHERTQLSRIFSVLTEGRLKALKHRVVKRETLPVNSKHVRESICR